MGEYIGGLDVGQTTDPAALAVLRKDGHGEQAVGALQDLTCETVQDAAAAQGLP